MSILGLLCLLLALVAALLLVLYGLQRRELHSIGQLSQQLLRIAAGGPIPERLDRGSDKAEIAGLVTAVNHLLRRARGGTERDAAQAPRLFTDKDGRISFLNPAAEQLTGSGASAAQGKLLEEIVSLVDETDRRLLSDPVHQALTTGAPVNLSRRALLLSRTNGSERSIELSASPIRNSAQDLLGAVVLLHDVTEML